MGCHVLSLFVTHLGFVDQICLERKTTISRGEILFLIESPWTIRLSLFGYVGHVLLWASVAKDVFQSWWRGWRRGFPRAVQPGSQTKNGDPMALGSGMQWIHQKKWDCCLEGDDAYVYSIFRDVEFWVLKSVKAKTSMIELALFSDFDVVAGWLAPAHDHDQIASCHATHS